MMQPYFFPYLGYFSLIQYSDYFILSDNVQYIDKGWINRNRILKQNQGFMYINIPLIKHKHDTVIHSIKIDNTINWQSLILKNLQHYKKKAPYYSQTIDVVKQTLDAEVKSITKLNERGLQNVCNYIGLEFKHGIYSELNLKTQTVSAPDEWALMAAIELGFDEYVNPPRGIEIYDKNKFQENGIKLTFLKNNLPFYIQRRGRENFINGLSIIDVMMFNPKEKIKEMLNDYTLL